MKFLCTRIALYMLNATDQRTNKIIINQGVRYTIFFVSNVIVERYWEMLEALCVQAKKAAERAIQKLVAGTAGKPMKRQNRVWVSM